MQKTTFDRYRKPAGPSNDDTDVSKVRELI